MTTKRFVKLHQHPLDGGQEMWFDPLLVSLIYPYQFDTVVGTMVYAGTINPTGVCVIELFPQVMALFHAALYGDSVEREHLKAHGLMLDLYDWQEPTP